MLQIAMKVGFQGKRLRVDDHFTWPATIRTLLTRCFDTNHQHRPKFREISESLASTAWSQSAEDNFQQIQLSWETEDSASVGALNILQKFVFQIVEHDYTEIFRDHGFAKKEVRACVRLAARPTTPTAACCCPHAALDRVVTPAWCGHCSRVAAAASAPHPGCCQGHHRARGPCMPAKDLTGSAGRGPLAACAQDLNLYTEEELISRGFLPVHARKLKQALHTALSA